jgi:hypothetical protein
MFPCRRKSCWLVDDCWSCFWRPAFPNDALVVHVSFNIIYTVDIVEICRCWSANYVCQSKSSDSWIDLFFFSAASMTSVTPFNKVGTSNLPPSLVTFFMILLTPRTLDCRIICAAAFRRIGKGLHYSCVWVSQAAKALTAFLQSTNSEAATSHISDRWCMFAFSARVIPPSAVKIETVDPPLFS